MTYGDIIEKIMDEANAKSDEPILLYREDGEWQFAYARNAFGKEFEYVAGIRERDPAAVTVKGKNFTGASLATVYDRILTLRMRKEYNAIPFGKENLAEYQGLVNFVEDHIAEFTGTQAAYLTTLDEPLRVLYDMNPLSLKEESISSDKAEAVMGILKVRLDEAIAEQEQAQSQGGMTQQMGG
jgi:hypothetical protein